MPSRPYERGVQPVHWSGDPESQEGDRESLKSTIALAIDVLFKKNLNVFTTIFSLFRQNNYVKFT